MFIFSSKTILEFHFSHPNHWYCWRGCAARLEKSKQPLSHSARVAGAATQPLTHSERLGSHSATHSVRVARAAYWSTQKKNAKHITSPQVPRISSCSILVTLCFPQPWSHMVPTGPGSMRPSSSTSSCCSPSPSPLKPKCSSRVRKSTGSRTSSSSLSPGHSQANKASRLIS